MTMRDKKFMTALCCIVAALLLWGALVVCPEFPGAPTNDTLNQLEQVHNNCINNWKPALYAYLLMLGEYMFPAGGIKLGYLAQCSLFAVGFGLIVLSLCRVSLKYLLLLSLLPFFGAKGCMLTAVGNDAMAASCYVTFIGCVMISRVVGSKFWRVAVLIAGIAILWYGMAMRHNSIFAVAVLLAWSFWSLSHTLKRALCLSIATVSFFLILNFSVLNICHVEKAYPLKSPFASDLVNISILKGEWDSFCIDKQKRANHMLEAPNKVAKIAPDVCNFYQSGLLPYENIKDPVEREHDYEEYKEAWVRCITDNPLKYITLKVYFFHQFLMAGRSIPQLDACIEAAYPGARVMNNMTCGAWSYWCNRLFAFNALLPLVSYLALLFMLYKIAVIAPAA